MSDSREAPAAAAAWWPAWPEGPADALERDLLERWSAEGLFAAVQAATAAGAPWVFYEGPPTANGRPGIHHVFSRTIKDLICRYHVMQGQRVTRIAGWDTHGLPVELEIEKQLGFKGKKDIEAFGVAEFNRRCLDSVFTYRDEWVDLSSRIGYWLDYDRAYVTCTRDYIETVWWLLKQLHDKALLYRGHRVLPYCPRCGTTLSSHELALGYEDVRDKSVYLTLPLLDGSNRELVVWTTTPWTLPSNVAVAVHPELEYGEFTTPQRPGKVLVLLASRGAAVLGEDAVLVRTVPGRDLVGLEYQRPLDVVPLPDGGRHSVVVPGDFVTAGDGSGLVHMAPAFGADDYAAGQEHGLALLRPVAPDGTFSGTNWPELEGKLVTAPETNDLIIRRLKETGRHLRTEQHLHSYPHCWRCRSKLIYYARDSWFVRTTAIRDRMLHFNAGIAWHPPETGTGRFGEWLAGNVDWALSRERYWGTPLPIWVNDRDPSQVVVIGSLEELREKTGYRAGVGPRDSQAVDRRDHLDGARRWDDAPGVRSDRHLVRFGVDADTRNGTIRSSTRRICQPLSGRLHLRGSRPDAGLVLFAARHRHRGARRGALPERDRQRTGARPAGPEDVEESRQRGRPVAGDRRHGADAVRLYLLAASQVWQPKRFDPAPAAGDRRRIPQPAAQRYQFYALFAGPRDAGGTGAEPALADRWILGRLDATVAAVRAAFDDYDVTAAVAGDRRFRRRPVELVRPPQPRRASGPRTPAPTRRRWRRSTRRW